MDQKKEQLNEKDFERAGAFKTPSPTYERLQKLVLIEDNANKYYLTGGKII